MRSDSENLLGWGLALGQSWLTFSYSLQQWSCTLSCRSQGAREAFGGRLAFQHLALCSSALKPSGITWVASPAQVFVWLATHVRAPINMNGKCAKSIAPVCFRGVAGGERHLKTHFAVLTLLESWCLWTSCNLPWKVHFFFFFFSLFYPLPLLVGCEIRGSVQTQTAAAWSEFWTILQPMLFIHPVPTSLL